MNSRGSPVLDKTHCFKLWTRYWVQVWMCQCYLRMRITIRCVQDPTTCATLYLKMETHPTGTQINIGLEHGHHAFMIKIIRGTAILQPVGCQAQGDRLTEPIRSIKWEKLIDELIYKYQTIKTHIVAKFLNVFSEFPHLWDWHSGRSRAAKYRLEITSADERPVHSTP